MPFAHSLLIVAAGLACWVGSYFAGSQLTAVMFFVMGFGVILVGASSFFERLFERIAGE